MILANTALQFWNNVVIIGNNVATLCCVKNRRCESSRVYGGSEVTCRKPDTFLLAASFAASLILLRLLLRILILLRLLLRI